MKQYDDYYKKNVRYDVEIVEYPHDVEGVSYTPFYRPNSIVHIYRNAFPTLVDVFDITYENKYGTHVSVFDTAEKISMVREKIRKDTTCGYYVMEDPFQCGNTSQKLTILQITAP